MAENDTSNAAKPEGATTPPAAEPAVPPATEAGPAAAAPSNEAAPSKEASEVEAEAAPSSEAITELPDPSAESEAATQLPADAAPSNEVPAEASASEADSTSVETASTEKADESDEDAKASNAPELPTEGEMSFAEMFELAEKQSEERRKNKKSVAGLRSGQVLNARIVSISHDSVFLDVGAKAEGVIPKVELADENGEVNLKEGDAVEARVRKFDGGTVLLTKVLPHQSLKNREALREAHEAQLPVEGRVTGQNKGGFDVEIMGMRAFCPASQIDLRPGKGDEYLYKKFPFRIVELKDGGRNIVVSRKALIAEEKKKQAEKVLATLSAGDTVQGTVSSLKDYGAFVDIGGIEGLVHTSEISHGHVGKPKDALKIGDMVAAKVLKLEDGKEGQKKVSLSIKALTPDPWDGAIESIKVGQKVQGKVRRLQDFGAFVEIMPGVDGLIHVSNMSLDSRVRKPSEVVKVGDDVEATVINADFQKRRIGLSLVKTKQELANELQTGTVYEGTVDKIESFGLFVKLPSGARGLVPAAETGTQRGADLTKEFEPGTVVKVAVLDKDGKSGRIRLSIRSARAQEERAEYAGYLGKKSSGKGLGTLGDILKAQLGDKFDLEKSD